VTATEIAEAFKGRREESGRRGSCPVHAGHNLAVRDARDGHLLVKCWDVSCDQRKSPRSGGPATAAKKGEIRCHCRTGRAA
jgi:hypothetical protein